MSIKIALAGNPNSGKTTLFNALTGSNQFVGNWPGVTVEKKEGKLKGHKDVIIMDLPGIYSLSPYTLEEVVARNYLISERPDAILNIVDGTNIERNLYLSTQLMELGIPVVMAVNMMDVVEKSGDKIHIGKLSQKLGCEVVEISALKGNGVQKAAEKAIAAAGKKEGTPPVHKFAPGVEQILEAVEDKLDGTVPQEQRRFFAVKLLEKDDKIQSQMKHVPDVSEEIRQIEEEMDDDTESIITNERYEYIGSIISQCYKKHSKEKLTTSDKIDRIVTNRFLALPIFAVVMLIVYSISVTTVGTWATDWANEGVFGDGWSLFGLEIPGIPVLIESALTAVGCAAWLQGLILDGIVAGVGAVLGFVPQMLVLFIFLAFLESCGYMARIAFIMDRIFRKFGLSGKSFIPMLIGSGCGVPGVMASRTIENDRDRKMTIMTTTFIPCGAKLPIIALIAGALFGGAWWVAPSAYFVGIAAIICSGIILKKTKMFAGDPAPFVMELPAYHLPTVGNVLAQYVGKRLVLYKESRHNHTSLYHFCLVYLIFWMGRRRVQNVGRHGTESQYSCGYRKRSRLDLCSSGMGRLEICCGSNYRTGGKRKCSGNLWYPLWLRRSGRGRNRDLGNPCRQYDSSCGILFPGIQSAVRTLLCSNGRYQERDEQCEMVLVCHRISDYSCLWGIPLCIPDG